MKAMILAAGMGTRLLPFTQSLPKPLFRISERTVLDRIIEHICRAGFEGILINTHHLHQQVEAFIRAQQYPVPVETRFEPAIRGTGGALKNISDWVDADPLLVVNGDILFDADLKAVYEFHREKKGLATLVLWDDPSVNTVAVDTGGAISAIAERPDFGLSGLTWLTFTGIQVIEPQILVALPDDEFSSIIPTYRHLIRSGQRLQAYILKKNGYWRDIGTPGSFQEAALDLLSVEAFRTAFPDSSISLGKTVHRHLEGDGSDRSWHRLYQGDQTLIAANHGIKLHTGISEIDSFVNIGLHLHQQGLSVPKIYAFDTFSGWVILEDLGETNLQNAYTRYPEPDLSIPFYKEVIRRLIAFNRLGFIGFDPAWTFQSTAYDTSLILEKECRYFIDSFINGLLGWNLEMKSYEDEFLLIAERALKFSYTGLMHRDFQSRNIMIKDGTPYFIDFQGARMGPIQYDLASLLIDPYVTLPVKVQRQLLDFCIRTLPGKPEFNEQDFRFSYLYASISRNLQILGAFSYLSQVKNKKYFLDYIPGAVRSLIRLFSETEASSFPKLTALSERIAASSIPCLKDHP
ncbi:MAG: sugar phosphate nucleotidyltransferase [Thermodesulfobacteriota bacterium]